ncbi:hypothetical protein ACIBUY_19000 [Streptomyces sp. NPDC050085]|uniref:hypothetical protein n=1 Tax=Streptomyces sp. NPDC050085 TaxID=3365600 RepID=UPI0037AB6C09
MLKGAKIFASLALAMTLPWMLGCGAESDHVSTASHAQGTGAESAERDLRSGKPPAKVLTLHRLSIPRDAEGVRYRIDDGWSSYGLQLTFEVPRAEADAFLKSLGVSEEELTKGFYLPEADAAGWKAAKARKYVHGSSDGAQSPSDAPTHSVVLDVTDASRTTVYLTSVVVA